MNIIMANICEAFAGHFLGKKEYLLGKGSEYCDLPGHETDKKYPFSLDMGGRLEYGLILPMVPSWTNSGSKEFDSLREIIKLGNYIELVIRPEGTRKMLYPAEIKDRFPEALYIPARVAYLKEGIATVKTRTLTDVEISPDSPKAIKDLLKGELEYSSCSKIDKENMAEAVAAVIYPSIEFMKEGMKREDFSIELDKLDPQMKSRLGR